MILIAAALAATAAIPCSAVEADIRQGLAEMEMVADETGILGALGRRAIEGAASCRGDRKWLAYFAARAAELLERQSSAALLPAGTSALRLARQAAADDPASPAPLTIVARLTHDCGLVANAHRLAPRYVPAHHLLAECLARQGRAAEALALLDRRSATTDHLARARVFLILGRKGDALAEARAAFRPPFHNPDEPDVTADLVTSAQDLQRAAAPARSPSHLRSPGA